MLSRRSLAQARRTGQAFLRLRGVIVPGPMMDIEDVGLQWAGWGVGTYLGVGSAAHPPRMGKAAELSVGDSPWRGEKGKLG